MGNDKTTLRDQGVSSLVPYGGTQGPLPWVKEPNKGKAN